MYRYCGKIWKIDDIANICNIIAASPSATRAVLSRLVCEAFNWRSPDGRLKEMSCRVAMLRMARDGLILLPPPRYERSAAPIRTLFTSERSDPQPLLQTTVNELDDLRVELVGRGPSLSLWNEYISRYHYLGYKMLPGAQLRYFIMSGDRVLGAMGFGASAWKVEHRDKFIGWTAGEREARLHLIVNQSRFLILPWVQCKNLATKTLALVSRRIVADWFARYAYSPVLMETFVDTTKFQGTCYKAGNWINVGLTKGRSKMDRYNTYSQPIKSIWLMPLCRNFRPLLLGR